jgi:hypothetical protein
MNKLVTILLLFLVVNTLQAQDLVGTWQGDDGAQIGAIIFDADGYCTFMVGGQTMGGKEFEIDGNKGSMSYAIDYKMDPIAVTITITRFESKTVDGDSTNIYGLLQFIDKDNIRLALGNPEEKVTEFTPLNSIQLVRKIE